MARPRDPTPRWRPCQQHGPQVMALRDSRASRCPARALGGLLLRRADNDVGVRVSNLTLQLCVTENSRNLSELLFSQLQKGAYAAFFRELL